MTLTLVLLIFVLAFGLGAWRGAPYLPILHHPAEDLLDLADLSPGQTLIDLGSGDGRLLRLAAQRGIRGIGYEINPLVYMASLVVCWRYRKLVTIHTADIWHTKLPRADVIYIFILERHMGRLEHKFITEITQPTRVISYIFRLPTSSPTHQTHNTYTYEFGSDKTSA